MGYQSRWTSVEMANSRDGNRSTWYRSKWKSVEVTRLLFFFTVIILRVTTGCILPMISSLYFQCPVSTLMDCDKLQVQHDKKSSWISWGTQASMSPRRTEWLRGAENYTHFFHKKKIISQQPFIRFFPLLSLIERYLSPLFNEVIYRFFKKSFIMAFLPSKRYPSLYFSLCNLVIFFKRILP